MSVETVEARPAATVILVRDAGGVEVLMVERVSRGFFGGLMVFPGGGVDDCDLSSSARWVVRGDLDDHPSRAAAIRELAEETSILFTGKGLVPSPPARGADFYRALNRQSRTVDGDALTLVSRWVTPHSAPRRYDTRFYLAVAHDDPVIVLDTDELVSYAWVTPARALQRHEAGDWKMFTPTISHLRWLAQRSGVNDVLRSAAGADARAVTEPLATGDGSIVAIGMPGWEV